MVEKPKREDAPSLFAAAGRYVLDRAIFGALRRIDRGSGGESAKFGVNWSSRAGDIKVKDVSEI